MWNLLLLFPLGKMVCSDFRERRIGLVDLSIFGILQWGIAWGEWGWKAVWLRFCFNSLLFCYFAGGIIGYYFLRHKCPLKVLKKQIGSGDLWFCLLLFPAFTWKELTFFLTFSIGVILSVWFCCVRLKEEVKTIPLVSGLGIMYMLWILIQLFIYG